MADHVPCSHSSHLPAWQTGVLETRLWCPQGKKEDANWGLYFLCEHPCSCHWARFWGTNCLPYFQVLPLLSASSCIFHRVAWNRLCESRCSGRVAVYIFILARRMKEYVFWSDLQVFLLVFSAQLSNSRQKTYTVPFLILLSFKAFSASANIYLCCTWN